MKTMNNSKTPVDRAAKVIVGGYETVKWLAIIGFSTVTLVVLAAVFYAILS
jgi:hypothetical protein